MNAHNVFLRINTFPAPPPVVAGCFSTFSVTFTPGGSGTRTAQVSIPNNDSDEGTYSFTVNGTEETSTSFLLWTK